MAHILFPSAIRENLETEISIGSGTIKLRYEKSGSWTIEGESNGSHEPPLRINFRGENGYALAIAFLLSVGEKLREPTSD